MSSINPFQPSLPRFPESYERTRIQPQQPPPVSSSPPPPTPPTPYWPLSSTPPIGLTPLHPYHDWETRSPSLGPPPPTPPTPHDPRLDIDSATPTPPPRPRPRPQARSPSVGPPPPTLPTPHDPWLDTHSETPTPPQRPRPRPRPQARRRRRPQARPQAPPYLDPATPNIIDPMSRVYNPPSPDFEAFGNHYKARIAARASDLSAKRDFTYRTIVESLADVNKQVRMKRVFDALEIFDNAVEREEKMINRALGRNTRVMQRCHTSCAQATTERDDRRIIQGLGRVWRIAVDDEIELEYWRGINRKRHWKAVRAMLERKTLGWRMRIRRLKAKGRRDARKLRPVRRAVAWLGERREAKREGGTARGGDSGDEADDSWTDSSSGELVDEQVEEEVEDEVEDEEDEDATLGWAETYRLL